MKLSGGKRVLMFFHWLLSLLICAGLVAYVVWPGIVNDYYNQFAERYGQRQLMICGIAVLAIYLVLAIAQLVLIFKRRKKADRGFIVVDSSDNSRVRIAISAIEQMVRQSVNNIDGINDMKIAIDNLDDAIQIGVRASIVNGSHVPTITMNMQRAIRQFVEMNCGVAVRAVSITIKSVTASADGGHKNKKKKGKGEAELPVAPVIPAPQTQPVEAPVPAYAPENTPVSEQTYEAPAYVPPVVEEDVQSAYAQTDAEPQQAASASADDPIASYFAGIRAEAEEEAAEAPESDEEPER